MKLRLLTRQLGSQSLKRVAQELTKRLGYRVWRSAESRPKTVGAVYGDPVDKIAQYRWFREHDVPALEFTTSQEEANKWAKKTTVFARKTISGSEGRGIVIVETGGSCPLAPVYTKYQKKKKEFRVHIFQDRVVSVVEKRKRGDYTGNGDPRVRNTVNGFVFCHNDVVEPAGIRELALLAAQVTPSDFKGVDIGFNEQLNKLFVIEVNSAPGIEGSNVTMYADTIIKKLNLKKLP
jgi:hypothetical protein